MGRMGDTELLFRINCSTVVRLLVRTLRLQLDAQQSCTTAAKVVLPRVLQLNYTR